MESRAEDDSRIKVKTGRSRQYNYRSEEENVKTFARKIYQGFGNTIFGKMYNNFAESSLVT